MSRIIKTENGFRMRERALKLIGKAISEFENAKKDADLLDIASFIALMLDEIENSVQETSVAWEKREYWIKADQFRSEWNWVGQLKAQLMQAIQQKDLENIGEIFERLRKNAKVLEGMIKVRKGIDYIGSYSRFKSKFG
ncbi:MAG: hypothetical protein D6735_09085 [Acidobacteria bacterium]|jgi:hypothetical protein|nr:MAG: hypothetical protein DDG59_03110 [Anaerolineae bacterium]RMG03161.1 MAG: hypothetical protein D6735_09085 [Acidobacteriota bacterium]